jgi:hypothetical protein
MYQNLFLEEHEEGDERVHNVIGKPASRSVVKPVDWEKKIRGN